MLKSECFIFVMYCSNQSDVSDDRRDISVDNDYEENDSVSNEEVNMSNIMTETSNDHLTEGEIVSETVPISACPSNSGSDITMTHFYMNTNIFNTNEHIEMSADNETVLNHPNELGIGNNGMNNKILKVIHFQVINT